MNTLLKITATLENAGERVDQFLAHGLNLSRSHIQFLINSEAVQSVNNKVSASRRVKAGEIFEVQLPQLKPSELTPQNLVLDILYADEDIIVINKPAGMVVHPSPGHADNTLVNALLYHYPDMVITHEQRPGIVHRLDKETSGAMVCARNNAALENLMQSFRDRRVEKIYRAFCWGQFDKSAFDLKTGHKRHTSDRKRYTTKIKAPQDEIAANGNRLAHSHFEVMQSKQKISELRVQLFTGRTHQIRAQLADIGHPLLLDQLYGGVKNLGTLSNSALKTAIAQLTRHALHSERLSFKHPRSGEQLSFIAPLPYDLRNLHEAFEKN